MVLPEYAQLRAARKPPEGCCIPDGAIPTIAYGDPAKARIATIGLNPGHGHQREARRGAQPGVAPGARAEMYGYDYFTTEVGRATPGFFNPLEKVIVACGASYLDGSACHLDLAQWPTSESWRDLPPCAQAKLLEDGAPFVRRQLEENPGIKLLLGDGAGVINALAGAFCVTFEEANVPPIQFSRKAAPLYTSEVEGCPVIGWRPNLQSDFGVYGVNNEGKRELAQRVGELARGILPRRFPPTRSGRS